MGNLQIAYNYMVMWCNSTNPYCGYSQEWNLRCGGMKNGIKYFDCSGMISTALYVAGFFSRNPCFATGEQNSYMYKAGFREVNLYGEWKPGDVLWRRSGGSGHTEMVYKGRVTMGAHTAQYTLAKQVSINTYSSKPSEWMKCWRYTGDVTPGEDVGPYDEWDSWDYEHNGPGEGHGTMIRYGAASDVIRRLILQYGE